MRDIITSIIIQSITESGLVDPCGDTLQVHWEDIAHIAEQATGEILDAVDAYAQKQWDAEYDLARLPQ